MSGRVEAYLGSGLTHAMNTTPQTRSSRAARCADGWREGQTSRVKRCLYERRYNDPACPHHGKKRALPTSRIMQVNRGLLLSNEWIKLLCTSRTPKSIPSPIPWGNSFLAHLQLYYFSGVFADQYDRLWLVPRGVHDVSSHASRASSNCNRLPGYSRTQARYLILSIE